MIKKYCREVEAVKVSNENWDDVMKWIGENDTLLNSEEIEYEDAEDEDLIDKARLEGGLVILPNCREDIINYGDYIVKTNKGFYVYSPGLFEKLYREMKNVL